MDENMPVMKGSQASRIIRSECGHGPVPILISLTANAFDEARDEALAAGFHDFVSKPFEKDDLLAKLRKHLKVGQAALPVAVGI
jgi:CheY-like chemotaxis protein